MTDENVQAYLNNLEKVFTGRTLTPGEAKLTREINTALELDPHLEEKILDNYLAPVTLHLEVNPVGTRWLVIPTASCPIVYKQEEGSEKMQTRFKSLRMKLEELKNKGVFLEKGKIVIK